MTTAIFLLLFFGLFIAVLNFLPTAGATTPAFVSAIITFVGYMKAWDFLFPVTEIFVCVGIVVSFEIVVWTWHVLVFVLKKVRGATQ